MKKPNGFTLIEVLIYSAIVAGFITFAVLAAYQIIDFSGRLENQRELSENERFLAQKLSWVLSGVDTINAPVAGASGATLSVNKLNFSQNPLVIDLANGVVRLTGGSGPAVPLTNSFASSSNLIFRRLDFSGQEAIRVTVNLENKTASSSLDYTIIVK